MAQGDKEATVYDTGFWIRFPLEEVIYLIFLFQCSGNKAKRIEFRHPTYTASRIQEKTGNGFDGSGVV